MANLHSYACQVLRGKGYKIFVNGVEILTQPYNVVYPNLTTQIKKDTNYRREYASSQLIRINDLMELSNLGFKLLKFSPKVKNFDYQRVSYRLVRNNYYSDSIATTFPSGHYAEYDVINRSLRLIGKNADSFSGTGAGEWTPIDELHEVTEMEMDRNPFNRQYNLARADLLLKKNNPLGKLSSFFNIDGFVIGITEEGKICAMPKPKVTDMYFIAIYGAKGTGKSLLMNSLQDSFIHKGNIAGGDLNDNQVETFTRCTTWKKNDPFLEELGKFGEPTLPKPCVYLHPTTNHPYKKKVWMGEVGFDMSLSYKNLLKDENLVLDNKGWDMKKSGAFLDWKAMIRKDGQLRFDELSLLSATSLASARQIIEKQVHEKGKREKINLIITDIFNSNMVDVSSKVASKWIVKYGDDKELALSPICACLFAGLFPVLNTSAIRDEAWFALSLKSIMKEIIDFVELYKIPTMLWMDEIASILKEKATREIIERVVRELRKSNIGFGLVCHHFSDMPAGMTIHSDYEFAFKTTDDKLISYLRSKRKINARQAQEISFLGQSQFYAFGKFDLYDTDGSVTSNEGMPVKIVYGKPPNCRHYGGNIEEVQANVA